MENTAYQVQLIYIGLLGRAADQAGLDYWVDEIENGVLTIEDLRANIVNEQQEYADGLGSMTRAQVVSQLYANLFNREADADGLEYWVDGAGAGVNVDQLVLALIEGAAAPDRLVLDNKAEAAVYYTETVGDAYSEDDARDAVVSVDETAASVDASQAESDAIAEAAAQPAPTTIEKAFTDITAGDDASIEGWSDNAVQVIHDIGKAEWDEAGQVATSSKDYTFTLSNQIGSGETYAGLFLSPVLSAEDRSADSQLFIQLRDLRADGNEPLGELPVNGFRFFIEGDDEAVVFSSEEIFAAKTYAELLAAVNDALAASEDPRLESFTAELGGQFVVQDDNGVPVEGTTLVLTDAEGRSLEEGNFTYSEDASSGGFTLYGEQSTEAPVTIDNLIETNLELDNIGYGSQGGTINLVGQSNSDKGVEQFNVTATNGVWLTRLESQSVNNSGDFFWESELGGQHFLKEINLEGSGAFHVGQQDGDSVVNPWHGQAGLVDVQDFNAANFDGDIKLSATITGNVVERDLDAMDDDADPTADNQNFTYTTAAGDDELALWLGGDLMAREDASVQINAGNGDNVVQTWVLTNAFGSSDNQLVDQQLNANLSITTGSGRDVISTYGAGDAVIESGAGNDVIYADNFGDKASWTFNDAGDDVTSNSDVPLSSGASGFAQTYPVFKLQLQVSFKGYESQWVTIESTDKETSILQVNQAVKNAVNNDAVLSNLLEASDGDGNILNLESLIDGANAGELSISLRGPHDSSVAPADRDDGRPVLTQQESDDLPAGGMDAFGTDLVDNEEVLIDTSGGTAIATEAGNFVDASGGASSAESDNTINAGTGNDVIVLGTDDVEGGESNDTVVFEGQFGNDTIVNFVAGDSATAGFDILDFSSYEVDALSFAGTDYAGGDTSLDDIEFIRLTEDTDNAGLYEVELVTDVAGDETAQVLGTVDFGNTDFANIADDNFVIA